VILESIYNFAKNQTKTINKFLYLDGWLDRTNESDHGNVHPLLCEL
jgi:hypothetical protein